MITEGSQSSKQLELFTSNFCGMKKWQLPSFFGLLITTVSDTTVPRSQNDKQNAVIKLIINSIFM